ncbi:MAG: translation initiation factor IF-5A [Nanoarchaeota archaeon]|nr:translation initiation factor IF-5A [Nanoarchaeota archaeon]MBU4242491.1 translation initiation factor IF-5A [Nanoarchaeota archaeon]MBU4352025.1 translation initiation factor IF-5A [Nanoarchaeota archaeon]MBU4456508.1 translation initiation factor IF-5A [Nanoarchaeota archaeon]MCG2719316.1 translation initiation factor IF-5A [Nanoarchaeota archaeon]
MSGDTIQKSASDLKPGSYVIFDDLACTVKSVEKSKTGKHGSAKCRVEAISIIDNKKIIKVMPGHDKVKVPIIDKKAAQVLSVKGDTATVMDMTTYETFDIKITEDIDGEVKEGNQVVYWIIMGQRVLKQAK